MRIQKAHNNLTQPLRVILAALLVLAALLLLETHAFADKAVSEPMGAFVVREANEAETDADEEKEADDEDDEADTPLTFDAPFTHPESVADVYGSADDVPGLRLEVFPLDDLYYKFTFYGTGELFSYLRKQLKDAKEDIDYSYRYELRMISDRDVTLKGKITYREQKRGEPERITWISSKLHCKELSYNSKHPRVEENKLSWLVGMQKWFGFSLDKVTGFELTIYNAYDTRQKVIYFFEKDAVLTDTMLYTSLRKGGLLRVTVHDTSGVTITITDPKLRDGYKNSPDEVGAIDPFWHVQTILTARGWAEAILEGQPGQDMDHMDYYAGEYHRLPDESNEFHAESTEVPIKSYSIDGNDVIMYFMMPSGTGLNPRYIRQIAVDMNNGTVLKNNVYNVY